MDKARALHKPDCLFRLASKSVGTMLMANRLNLNFTTALPLAAYTIPFFRDISWSGAGGF
jgi:hypothetical protein